MPTKQEILDIVNSAAYVPALNGVSNVEVAYGTVQLVPGSKVKAMRIQRGNSTVQADFYFESNGKIDALKVLRFLDSETGYVAKLYNQVNSSTNHASQSTLALMPIVRVDEDGVKVRYPDTANGNNGQAMTFTTAALTGNNFGMFSAYRCQNAAATNNANGFTKRTLIGSSGGLLDLGADAAATNFDALMLGASSTSTLYFHSHNTYLSLISNGTAATIDSGGINTPVALAARTTATETTWTLGNNNGTTAPFCGDLFAFVLFNAAPAQGTIDNVKTGLQDICGLVISSSFNLFAEGDSLTQGTGVTDGQNWPNIFLSRRKDVWFTNMGIGGSTLWNSGLYVTNSINNRVVHTDRNLVAGKTNTLIIWVGTNDIGNVPRTGAQAYADLVTYAQARKAAGWNKIIVLTMIPRNSTNETDRATLNSSIIANSTDWDYVVDIGSDPRLALVASFTGTNARDHNYWNADDIHLVNDGYAIVAAYVEAILANFLN